MIELNKINKKFGNKMVLDNLKLTLPENSFCAVKGKSGCGKTTLFKIIGLLDEIDGEIRIDNIKINKNNKENIRRKNMSYVFQEPTLLEYLDVYNNVILPAINLKLKIKEDFIDQLLDELGILDLKKSKVDKLSGGERTRVAIARALITNPKYVLMDEPIGNLDVENANNIMNMLKKIHDERKITILTVTHNNNYDNLYSNIFHLQNGKIYE